MDLTVPVRVGSEEMSLPQECFVRDLLVFGGLVYGDSKVDCGDCALPNVWRWGMQAIRDDSFCEYINYVGCGPDCVGRTVPEGDDDYPFGTLSSEPLCDITDDMTYQEKIEALGGTIYDYDDVSDNRLGYFDYDDPCDYEEWDGSDVPVDDGTCYGPYRSDAAGYGTIFYRSWLGDRSDGVVSTLTTTVSAVSDRSLSETPDLNGDLGEKTGIPGKTDFKQYRS